MICKYRQYTKTNSELLDIYFPSQLTNNLIISILHKNWKPWTLNSSEAWQLIDQIEIIASKLPINTKTLYHVQLVKLMWVLEQAYESDQGPVSQKPRNVSGL